MNAINEGFDSVIVSRFFDDSDVTHHCHDKIENELSKKQKILADVIYWVRNLNMGKEVCTKYGLHPGPAGHLDKKGRWWPSPMEACDSTEGRCPALRSTIKKGTKSPVQVSTWYEPWSVWKHCKTLQHCQYLVKYRLSYLYETFGTPTLDYLIRAVLHKDDLPLLINEPENNILKLFVEHSLSGLNPIMTKVY